MKSKTQKTGFDKLSLGKTEWEMGIFFVTLLYYDLSRLRFRREENRFDFFFAPSSLAFSARILFNNSSAGSTAGAEKAKGKGKK